ncbi:hypothetical protein IV203_027016 [Nitzschia inconspicua]|uniref:Uncharacterized protein n=1 Tax=Nitzschia inconspicua TaxID=303405 RepID=A0A9K3PY71_9STRA|nr:hypothetical protein IV203_027016 [Nitzschia inconspicua]
MEPDALMLSDTVPLSEKVVNKCNPINNSVEKEYKGEICSKPEEIVAASDSTITKSCLKCRRVCRGMCVICGCHRKAPRHGWEDGQFTQRRLYDAMLRVIVDMNNPEIEESDGRNKRLTKYEVDILLEKGKEKTTQPSAKQERSEMMKSVLLSLDGSKRRNLDIYTQSVFSVHSFLLRRRDYRSKLHESLLPLHNLRLGAQTKKPGTEPEKTPNQKRKGEWLYENGSEIFSITEEGSDDDQQEFPAADSYENEHSEFSKSIFKFGGLALWNKGALSALAQKKEEDKYTLTRKYYFGLMLAGILSDAQPVSAKCSEVLGGTENTVNEGVVDVMNAHNYLFRSAMSDKSTLFHFCVVFAVALVLYFVCRLTYGDEL